MIDHTIWIWREMIQQVPGAFLALISTACLWGVLIGWRLAHWHLYPPPWLLFRSQSVNPEWRDLEALDRNYPVKHRKHIL